MKTRRVAGIGWGNSGASNRANVFSYCFSLSVVMENSLRERQAVVELGKKNPQKTRGKKEKKEYVMIKQESGIIHSW